MAFRNILTGEDEALRKRSREITDFGERIHQLMDDLQDTLVENNGLGLAAPQVGVLRRAIVIIDGEQTVELLNPEITETDGEVVSEEACLSFPGLYGTVARPQKIKVRADNRFGETFEREFEGISARAVCHEKDHLDGVLFVDLAEELFEENGGDPEDITGDN